MTDRGTDAEDIVSIPDMLTRAAAQHPRRAALDFMGRKWSYAQLDRWVDCVARGLQLMEVAEGDRVCLALPNTPHYVILYFAVLRAGGIVVNMNPLYTERELRHLLEDSGARLAFVPVLAGVAERMEAAARGSGLRIVVCPTAEMLPPPQRIPFDFQRDAPRPVGNPDSSNFASLLRGGGKLRAVKCAADAVAVLQYTGGTTGVPKGAMLTHANLLANCRQMERHDQARPDRAERTMAVLPMFHVFALTTVLNYSVLTQAEIVLLPRFEVKGCLDALRRTRPERLFVVPTILSALNALPDGLLPQMPALRLCVSGGAPLPGEVRARFEERTGVRVLEGYGLSEASPIIACNPTSGQIKDGSAGVPFPGTVIEIRSLSEPDAPAPAGTRGEICVRGPQVMQGYWRRPKETRDVLQDGLLRTGDVGFIDDDGYLFIVDRIKDVILCGGYNVYPRVIEDALLEHPEIDEAVVVGVPDAYRGETPVAFVTLPHEWTEVPLDLTAHLAERLNKIEMPTRIEVREELPKTLIGKPSRRELRPAGPA